MSITGMMLGVTRFTKPRAKTFHTSPKTQAKLVELLEIYPVVTSEQVNAWMGYKNRASGTNAMLRLEDMGVVEHAGYQRVDRKPVSTWKLKV